PARTVGTHRDPQDRTRRSYDVRAEVPEGRSDDRTLRGAGDRGELPHDRNPDGAQPRRRHDRDELPPLPAGAGRRRGDVATIYSTVGLIGFKALAAGYQAAPGLTVGLAVCFVLAVVGLVIGLKKPHETSEAAAESEASIGPGAE